MKLLLPIFLHFIVASVAVAQVDLVEDFGAFQNGNGFQYFSFGDSRPVNTTNSSSQVTELSFVSGGTIANGSESFVGDVFVGGGDILPYVQREQRGFLALHPEAQPSGALAAAVVLNLQSSGTFLIDGDFARANNFRNQGNGVEVGIYLNENFSDPLFESSISADHDVSVDTVFSGTGVSSFRTSVDAGAGDRISFFVFADSQGSDAGFDVTALRGSITAVPEPSYGILTFLLFASFVSTRNRRL